MITTVVMSRDKKTGKLVQQSKESHRVTAAWVGNYARTKKGNIASNGVQGVFAGLADGNASFAQYSGDPNYTTDPSSMTPVLAVASGAVGYNYADTTTDSNGNTLEFYAWAADPSPAPITDAWAYKNGQLVVQYHASWVQQTDGYTLASQIIGSYYPDGTLAGTIQSTVTGDGGAGAGGSSCGTAVEAGTCQPAIMDDGSLRDKLTAPFRLALDKLGCWLGPKVAYAQATSNCYMEIGMFGTDTIVLGGATVDGEAFIAPPFYFIQWALWTKDMYELAHCFDENARKMPRGTNPCTTNPNACTGGGGSSW